MNSQKQYRQGDLLFVEVQELAKQVKKLQHKIIAEGEATGHKHQAVGEDVALYEDGNVKFLQAISDASIVHNEHKEIRLPKGLYRIIQQREYTPKQIQPVRD